MVKGKNKLLTAVIALVAFVVMPLSVSAKNHSFELDAYVCDPETYNDSDEVTNYNNCYADYVAGDLPSAYNRVNGSEIDAEQLVLFIVKYNVGSAADATSFNISYYYDPAVWTPG